MAVIRQQESGGDSEIARETAAGRESAVEEQEHQRKYSSTGGRTHMIAKNFVEPCGLLPDQDEVRSRTLLQAQTAR